MSGIRFCMLTTFYPPYNFGGDGIAIQRLSRALVRRGHRVTVVHNGDAYNLLSPTPNPSGSGEPPGLEVITLKHPLGIGSPLLAHQAGRPAANGRKIRSILRDGRFDVIWFHNVSLIGGPKILGYGEAVKIYEAHEHWLVCPTHVLWRHGREVCDERQCLRCVVRHKRPPQLWRYTGLLNRQLDHIDAFIAKSEFSRDKHREFGFPKPMNVVPYFLPDLEPGNESSPGPSPNGRPYFLFVGRLERIKGLDDVIPLFKDYSDADLLIAGDGEHGETLRGLGADVPNVRFLGCLTPKALELYYRHAIALIVPSVCYETFGIVLIEALRQGTPILARRIGPFPEIVQRSGGGRVFDGPSDLRTGMTALQHESGLRGAMAGAARDAFRQHWCESAVVPQYLKVVRDAASSAQKIRLVERLAVEVVG